MEVYSNGASALHSPIRIVIAVWAIAGPRFESRSETRPYRLAFVWRLKALWPVCALPLFTDAPCP
ncbi:MAG: hypothetical protein RLZZ607_2592 [Pseudomonadota bacterium]|jgi:hypothetical protein